MADKDQIKQHLSLSSTIKLDDVTPVPKGNTARKMRIMEHVKKSKGAES
ncbi:MAG: hypothetical protein AAFR42_17685 [Cyanobacteria bacterium J06628_6]